MKEDLGCVADINFVGDVGGANPDSIPTVCAVAYCCDGEVNFIGMGCLARSNAVKPRSKWAKQSGKCIDVPFFVGIALEEIDELAPPNPIFESGLVFEGFLQILAFDDLVVF